MAQTPEAERRSQALALIYERAQQRFAESRDRETLHAVLDEAQEAYIEARLLTRLTLVEVHQGDRLTLLTPFLRFYGKEFQGLRELNPYHSSSEWTVTYITFGQNAGATLESRPKDKVAERLKLGADPEAISSYFTNDRGLLELAGFRQRLTVELLLPG